MRKFVYLMQSRHGVYYVRLLVPKSLRTTDHRTERRISLRTKNRATALRLFWGTYAKMRRGMDKVEPWEIENATERDKYLKGIELIDAFKLDPHDCFALDELTNHLSNDQLVAYIHAWEHREAVQREASERLSAKSRPGVLSTKLPNNLSQLDASENDIPLTDAIKRFIGSKQTAGIATATKYQAQCNLFALVVSKHKSDFLISELSVQAVQRYVDILPKLPVKTKTTDMRSIDAIIASGDKRMGPKTLSSHAIAVRMFITWCEEQQYPIKKSLTEILKPLKKLKSDGKRVGFSESELKSLFESEEYQKGLFKLPHQYWLPLLGLFTGAREAELCQMHLNDVLKDVETNIWYFDFNQNEEKRLKTDESARRVPIHSVLIRMGFLDYVSIQKKTNRKLLFPDAIRSNNGEFSAFSKWFGRYRKKNGVVGSLKRRTDFHSFRHTIQQDLFEKGAREHFVNEIIGHSKAGSSEGVRTYYNRAQLKELQKTIERFKVGIDLSKIKRHGWRSKF
jgi:integrase